MAWSCLATSKTTFGQFLNKKSPLTSDKRPGAPRTLTAVANSLKIKFFLGYAQTRVAKGEGDQVIDQLRQIAEQPSCEPTLAAMAWTLIGQAHQFQSRLQEAKQAYQTELHLLQNAGNFEGQFDVMAKITHILHVLGEYSEAETLVRAQMDLVESEPFKKLKTAIQSKAAVLSDLSMILKARGQLDEAHALVLEAVAIRRELAKKDAKVLPKLAISLNSLGSILKASGDLQGAEEVYKEQIRHLRVLVRIDPARNLKLLASGLNNLGLVSIDRRLYDQAEDALIGSFVIRKQLVQTNAANLGDLANTFLNLGNLLWRQRKLGLAEVSYQECLSILERLPHSDADSTQNTLGNVLNNLGLITAQMGRHRDGMAWYEKALEIRRRLAAKDLASHLPGLALTVSNMTLSLKIQGKLAEALVMADEGMLLRRQQAESSLSGSKAELAMATNNYAVACLPLNRIQDARMAYTQSLALRRDLAATEPQVFLPAVAASLQNLAYVLLCQKQYAEAAEYSREAVVTIQQFYDAEPTQYRDEMATVLNTAGRVSRAMGDFLAAKAALEESVAIRHDQYSECPRRWAGPLLNGLQRLAEVLIALGDAGRAALLVEEADGISRRLYAEEFEGYDWSDLEAPEMRSYSRTDLALWLEDRVRALGSTDLGSAHAGNG